MCSRPHPHYGASSLSASVVGPWVPWAPHIPAVCREEAAPLPHRDSALPAPVGVGGDASRSQQCFPRGAPDSAAPLAHGTSSGAWGPGNQPGWAEVPRARQGILPFHVKDVCVHGPGWWCMCILGSTVKGGFLEVVAARLGESGGRSAQGFGSRAACFSSSTSVGHSHTPAVCTLKPLPCLCQSPSIREVGAETGRLRKAEGEPGSVVNSTAIL